MLFSLLLQKYAQELLQVSLHLDRREEMAAPRSEQKISQAHAEQLAQHDPDKPKHISNRKGTHGDIYLYRRGETLPVQHPQCHTSKGEAYKQERWKIRMKGPSIC